MWSTALYSGALAVLAGGVALARPMRWLLLPTRKRAALCAIAGVVLIIVVWRSVPSETRVPPITGIDEFMPRFHFRERHEAMVAASPERVFAAIKSVSAGEIALFQTFIWIRRFGRSGPESILNAPEHQPILDVATRTTFLTLLDRSPRELVVGTIVVAPPRFRRSDTPTPEAFRTLSQPGFAKATMNFRVEPQGSTSSRVVTETRVLATSDDGLRRFTPYWRAIFPGSAILRITWLRAIKARAERDAR